MKYKQDDYIIVTGSAAPELIGKTVRVHRAYEHDNAYMIDNRLPEQQYFHVWNQKACEENSYLNKTMTVLYNERPQSKTS